MLLTRRFGGFMQRIPTTIKEESLATGDILMQSRGLPAARRRCAI